MPAYLLSRTLRLVPILLAVTLLVTALIYLSPGDPVRLMLGLTADTATIERVRGELGLDKPFLTRYVNWLGNALSGDLGKSMQRNESVTALINSRLLPTLELILGALLISLLIAIPAGVLAAFKRGTYIDSFLTYSSVFLFSMPGFWAGLLAIMFFSVQLGWAPVSGRDGAPFTATWASHLVLPAVILGIRQAAMFMRVVRSSVLDVLNEHYVRTAHGKGLRHLTVAAKHVFRNSLIPIVTIIGLQLPELISTALIIENVFNWPGLGSLLYDAVLKRDYPLVQGIVVAYSLVAVLSNTIIDALYGVMDPRIKVA